MAHPGPSRRGFPRHGLLGLALVAVVWPLNWGLEGLRTHLLFFPLWLGYVLVVDALARFRRGTSAWTRHPRAFAGLFLLSVPFWWGFELLNERLRNWEYVGGERFGPVAYFALSSVSFSTVIPAVVATAELVRGSRWVERCARGPRFAPGPGFPRACVVAGLVMLAALLAFPRQAFAFEWTFGVFLLEPLCVRLGRRSFLAELAEGDWRTWVSLWVGVLVCGFFWEMWNSLSYPKWVYHVPYVGFGKVFEMPVLGYLGYLPFAMVLYQVVLLVFRRPPLDLLGSAPGTRGR